jgi:hypothetical protein
VNGALVIVRMACRRDYKNEDALAVEKSTSYGNGSGYHEKAVAFVLDCWYG